MKSRQLLVREPWARALLQLLPWALTLGAQGVACGCVGQAQELSVARVVASSPASETEFRRVRVQWEERADRPDAALELALSSFVDRYGNDGLTARARSYLAWVYTYQGRYQLAAAELARVGEPVGAVADWVRLVRAVMAFEQDAADTARAALNQLRGKLIDRQARTLLAQYLFEVSVSGRSNQGLGSVILDWLVLTPAHRRQFVQQQVLARLYELDTPRLIELLGSVEASRPQALEREYNTWLGSQIRGHLEQSAVERGDAALAQRLLEGRPEADENQRLALVARTTRVEGRTLGLLLEFGSETQEWRSAAVLAGVSQALGLPEGAMDDSRVKLIVARVELPQGEADSSGEGSIEAVRTALFELLSQGAALVIAGFTDWSARVVAGWASERAVGALVCHPLPLAAVTSDGAEPHSAESAPPVVFQLGVSSWQIQSAFSSWTATQRYTQTAVLGEGLTGCRAEGGPQGILPEDAVEALLLAGDTGCSLRQAIEAERQRLETKLVLGLWAAPFPELGPKLPFQISTGRFPTSAETAPASARAWAQRYGVFPSWPQSVGHDAAVLAHHALSGMPLGSEQAPEVVRQLHLQARARLLQAASGELWSTDAERWDARGSLPYRLQVVPRAPGGKVAGEP